ncbi:MAG: xylulokinase [Acidimicrobiales bacterium]
MPYVLAHDLGTTGDKATLYDDEGSLAASAFGRYETRSPRAGWFEQSPVQWWRATCETTQQVLRDAAISPAQVAAVSFSGQMNGATAVGANVEPLREAIIWADERATGQVAEVAARVDPRHVYDVTGHRLSASYSAAKILWVKELEPTTYRSTHKFLQAKDFLVAKLTGSFATDRSDASATNLYDLRAGRWSSELVEAFGLDEAKLPEICEPTAVVGEVSASAAEETGLSAGTPVVMGGGDGCAAGVGAGVVREGPAYCVIGSSAWIALARAEPVFDPEMRTFTFAHLVPGLFVPCGTMQAAGASYQFARDLFGQEEKAVAEALGVSAYELMDAEVGQSPPGARGLVFLPYVMGERSPRWDPEARGAFIGLTTEHRRPDLVRAVLEGVALNLRVILDAFRQQGASIESLRAIGGGARSAVWSQVLADVLGVAVYQLASGIEATSLGAAVTAGVGAGLWQDFSVAEQLARVGTEVLPREDHKPMYDELYGVFNDAYASLASSSVPQRLARVALGLGQL